MHPVRLRAVRKAALAVTVILALLSAWLTTAGAQADRLKAISASDSAPSQLRRGPDGKPLSAKAKAARAQGLEDGAGSLGSSDLMGTPADKTVARTDQVLRETNASGKAAGNITSITQYGLKADMSAPDSTPADVSSQSARATIDHNYKSVHGHFLDSTRESALQFKQYVAGQDMLYSLGTTDAAARDWKYDANPSQIDLDHGGTYVIKTGGATAITNSSAAVSGTVGGPATLSGMPAQSGSPDYAQEWAVVPANNLWQLVSRTDGLCLQHTTDDTNASVITGLCNTDPMSLWNIRDGGGDNLWSFQVTEGLVVPGLLSNGSTLSIGTSPQPFEAHAVAEPGGSVPTWSAVRRSGSTEGNLASPYTMAAGDLDGVVSLDGVESVPTYHDEAVVAYTDSDNNWQLRVIDYHAPGGAPGGLLRVTAPDPSLTAGFVQPGQTKSGRWYPGDYILEIGDFNGDGRNEIASATQNSDGNFTWNFWRYTAGNDGSRSITRLGNCLNCTTPFSSTKNITVQQGYADSAVGDFDGDGHDDIALAYANNVPTTTANSGNKVNLGVWSLNPDLSTRSVKIITPGATDDTLDLAPSLHGDDSRTNSGLQLVAGRLLFDPDNGFGPQRSELALGWAGYSVGEHVYNPNTAKDDHPYTIKPVVNIYAMSTGDCNSANTSCELSIDPTNGSDTPKVLFPSHAALTAYRAFGTGYDIPPITLEVGAFGGTGEDDPPVDGLLASAWLEYNENPTKSDTPEVSYFTQESTVVPWAAGNDDHTAWNITDRQDKQSGSDWVLRRYTAYDAAGASVILGAPTVLHLEQNVKENVVAAEPPTHVDWLAGDFTNVSATKDFYLETTATEDKLITSRTENENSWQNGVHEEFDAKVTFGEKLGPVDADSSIEVNQKFNKAWSGLRQSSSDASTSWTTEVSARTSDDDLFSYSADDTDLYRYPIIGLAGVVTGDSACTQGCRGYYDVYVPKGSVAFNDVDGQATTLFQPSWENMNALSYPVIDKSAAQPVAMPDLGSYSYTDQDGEVQEVTQPIYNKWTSIGGNAGEVKLDFSSAAGAGTTTTHARTWTVGSDVTVSGSISGSAPIVGEASLDLTASAGFDVSKSTSRTDTGSSSVSSDQKFLLEVPNSIDSSQAYLVGTAYYFSTDGATKVVHGVDLTGDDSGAQWWSEQYGTVPDPALNLPGRIDLGWDSDGKVYDKAAWITTPNRQLIRGFQILQSGDDGSGLPTAGDPYTINPLVGQGITLQVPVHNYSLADMTAPTTATWYAAPVDANNLQLTGAPVKIGASSVPKLGRQATALVQSPSWTPTRNSTNTMQQYRIFVRLDEAGTAADLHPLSGEPCPTSSLESLVNGVTPMLHDPMSTVATASDPLGCGQNNQGYGLVTVSPAAGASLGAERHATMKEPARAKLNGGALIDADGRRTELTEKSDVPTIPFGQRITGVVHASAALHTDEHPLVAIYDGAVTDGKIIAVTRMNGVDDQTGGHVTFDWEPDKPGVHELHQVLLGTQTTGEDDEQIMRINVAEPLSEFNVSATASAKTVKSGATFVISGKATPVPDLSAYRTVELRRKDGNGWTRVESQQTSSTGAFSFDLTAGKDGTYAYRVVKLAAPGRNEADSPTITVVVGSRFAVTAKASPTSIKLGRKSAITGTVSPPQSSKADRTVRLQRRYGSRWRTVDKGSTTAAGGYRFTVKPTKAGTYRYRVAKNATADRPTAISPTVTLKVKKR